MHLSLGPPHPNPTEEENKGTPHPETTLSASDALAAYFAASNLVSVSLWFVNLFCAVANVEMKGTWGKWCRGGAHRAGRAVKGEVRTNAMYQTTPFGTSLFMFPV